MAEQAQPRSAAVVEVAFAREAVTVPRLEQVGGADGLECGVIGHEARGFFEQGDHVRNLRHAVVFVTHDAEDAVLISLGDHGNSGCFAMGNTYPLRQE